MAAKAGAFVSWKEGGHTLLSQQEDSTVPAMAAPQAKRKFKLPCLDLSLCCCRNMAGSVDSPQSERQLLGGGVGDRHSRWVVTEEEGSKSRTGGARKGDAEGVGLFSRSASVKEARAGSSEEESWFSQAFRRPRKQERQQGAAGSVQLASGDAKKSAWDEAAATGRPETSVRARAAAAASWWGETPAEKRQHNAAGVTARESSSFRTYSRSGSTLSRSASTRKRTHEVIYSGDAKWKKVLRRVLNEARKIHLPAVSIEGPYNYDMLNYMKNFDMCPDDDNRPIRFRSLSSAGEFELQAELAAQLEGIRSDDEREISQDRSPARRAASRAVGIAVASVSPMHMIQ